MDGEAVKAGHFTTMQVRGGRVAGRGVELEDRCHGAIILEHVFEQQGQQAPVEDPVHPAYDRITGVADGLQASTMRA